MTDSTGAAGPATPRIGQVVLDSLDARKSAEFWRQLLGLIYREGHEAPAAGADDTRGRDWLNLESPDGEPRLAIQQVDSLARPTWPDATVPQQLHLDLIVGTPDELHDAVARATGLGAAVLYDRSGDAEEPLFVLADPDGHPFCVFVAD